MKKFGLLTIAALALTIFPTIDAAKDNAKKNDPKVTRATILDINRASAEDFEKLPGIGSELARRIVAFREKHGPFHRVEDLLAVEGIGPKKWRAIRPYLTAGEKTGDAKSKE
jgi:competence ComEA-like helix-hairpin-helix protein